MPHFSIMHFIAVLSVHICCNCELFFSSALHMLCSSGFYFLVKAFGFTNTGTVLY